MFDGTTTPHTHMQHARSYTPSTALDEERSSLFINVNLDMSCKVFDDDVEVSSIHMSAYEHVFVANKFG